MKGLIISVNVSDRKGIRKKPVPEAHAKKGQGIEGDAHSSADSHRQISLLAIESIRKIQEKGLDVHPGDFAENITTQGIELTALPIGATLNIGTEVQGVVSQIGKVCHDRCAIYEQAGDCVMPREGIFIKVTKGGTIRKGDTIERND